MMVENKIIMGEVDSLGGVMHLPEHWISVVIKFQQQQILYGNSLGQQIPAYEHHIFECWIKHLMNRSTKFPICNKVTIDWLPTQSQNDSTSCGLFALNGIAHHYLEHPLLSSDPITLACRRMEIVLHIIGSMMACLFQIVWNSIAQ
jgi:Ulp1 family protease